MNPRLLALALLAPFLATAVESLRPPAVPLVAHDPYFSVWSAADRLTDAPTTHWTGKPHRLSSLVRIDGKVFRVMGKDPESIPALPQTTLEVTPTRTLYRFEGQGVRLALTFMTPALPDDLDLLSRPLTYLTWEFYSIDGKTHEIETGFEAAGELAVDAPGQQVVAFKDSAKPLRLRLGAQDQRVLVRKGDDLRIDWGWLLVGAAPSMSVGGDPQRRGALASAMTSDRVSQLPQFPTPASNAALSVFFPAGKTAPSEPLTRWLMLAYDDEFSIRYFKASLRPYWRRNGLDAAGLLAQGAANYDSLRARCESFDRDLTAALERAGGVRYAQLCVLAYRQTFAANKLCADSRGQPLLFPKENFSNGCIGTVDVLFPQAPFFLALSPALFKGMLQPVLDYAASPLWPYDYAPHDLGVYPHATGQVYGMGGKDGDRMPVEESANMLVMLAALARVEGSAEFSRPFLPMLDTWARYLEREGLDPQNQLCSADMFGHLPRAANLALKAVLGIGAYAQICELTGQTNDARRFMAVARDYALRWREMARDNGRTRLAYHLPGTWSMKHNLIWDRVLGLNIIPEDVARDEIAWYLKVQGPYGLPVDNRTDTSLIDWALWSIAPARSDADFQALLAPLWRYVNETPSRVPFSDWFSTANARQKGFQARSVVGGVFIKMLDDPAVWRAWAKRGANTAGPWAPLSIPAPSTEVIPSARAATVSWRYTTAAPASNWLARGFDDSTWASGPGGFGTRGTPGAIIGTEWKTQRLWLRRAFTLPERPLKNPRLTAIYDEDPEIYINGVLAAAPRGWATSYEDVEISPEALATLKPGTNLLAVLVRQTYGGQCFDAGLSEDAPPIQPRMLLNEPVRDTCVCLAPDGTYYLTGTTGHPGWWRTNQGVHLWSSPDLVQWKPLGLVWSFDKDATWQKAVKDEHRAVWAPEIHAINGTFYIAYCINWPGGGTGILKSQSGRAEGPYRDVKPDGPLTSEIDASLFKDDDGRVYFVFQNGKIARLRDDMTALAEEPRLLKPANAKEVGFEGAFIAKIQGRYTLLCAEFNDRDGIRAYDCMAAHADRLEGPYGERYLAIPGGGHNMVFKDKSGQWQSTFFGNDSRAPWRERPGVLPITINASGRIQPQPAPAKPQAKAAKPNPLPGLRKLMDTPLRDTAICRGPDGAWYLTGTVEPFWAYNEGIKVWRSTDLTNWTGLGFVWKYGASPWHKPYLDKKKPLWAPEIHFLNNTFWLTYSIPGWDGTGKTSGAGLLKSTTGKAEGPYQDMSPDARLGDEIDASLFQEDDGSVYFLWHSGKIAKLKPDMTGLAEPYRWLKTTASDPNPRHHSGLCAGIFGKDSFDHVGYEGMFLFKHDVRYYLSCAENFDGRYSCTVASATNLFGPYGPRYEALPHGGHNTFFKDNSGRWWSTYFGSDAQAPWRERPGVLPVQFTPDGRLQPLTPAPDRP